MLLLPNEVLFEAFKFLNRRQLTNLERVCPRFHRIISDHIGEAPFLRLDFGFGLLKRFAIFTYEILCANARKKQISWKRYYFGDNFREPITEFGQIKKVVLPPFPSLRTIYHGAGVGLRRRNWNQNFGICSSVPRNSGRERNAMQA